MSGAVVIRRCASAEEAAIVCALLNDAGIPASLENWHHAMIDWGVLQALGGVGVRVPADMLDAAREAIIGYAESADERLQGEFPDLETGPLKPKRFRQFVLIGYYSNLLLAPLIIALMLIEIFYRVGLASLPGGFNWAVFEAELAMAHWSVLFVTLVTAAASFLVPLAILVLFARRFLARRAALKVPS